MQPYTLSFVKDVRENYLVVTLAKGLQTIEHQLEIIKRNLPPGIVEVSERICNNETKLYYSLHSKRSLLDLIEKEEINRHELMKILEEIVVILIESKNYLLSAENFLLRPQYIFMHPPTRKISLIYLPVKLEKTFDVQENYRCLLKELRDIRAMFPQELNRYLEEEPLNLPDFREYLMAIQCSLIINNQQEQEETEAFQETEVFPLDTGSPSFKEKKAARPLTIFFLAQLGIVVILFFFSSLIISSGDTYGVYIGLFLLVMSVDLILLKKLFNL